jgi:hypothetical protein
MLAANYYPIAFVAAGALAVAATAVRPAARLGLALAWCYLLPPLLGRLLLGAFGRPRGPAPPDSRAYRTWWLLTQIQMVFNRIPILEELLRLVPGAYALWLNLWGSRVSPFAYWAPGALVTDRYALRVGRGAVLGTRSLIGAHVVTRDADGGYVLIAAPLTIGAGSIVGALAAVGPGCHVYDNETLPGGQLLAPFTAWRGGRKVRIAADETLP